MKRTYLTLVVSFVALLSVSEGIAQKRQDKPVVFDKRVVFHLPDYPKNEINLFPNPAITRVNVRFPKRLAGMNCEVFDQAGSRCVKKQLRPGDSIDVSNLQTGTYIVRFTKGKEHYSQKLIVQDQ
ncbi:T9SS type A sorting domain-containing protein [Dyadobacter chenhuakuii]|uniref:T9SS type A sorting domain-containing protein n=1 Tax=Dyadobacter chenhuakuii TaxID=2909339 RepID=A0ABY4XFE0_9BACT|nr:T9SS type A sorting domain-containing protein [Dyadobacter chenhuakuii]MCF2491731.1 T9SS type A sorting domain-containing protein [Dyadobacter chenhuakuii]USJ29105.1 T9SS type A sorting domain-containing protein [Dyadobacter chenhuakuii]